MVKKINKKVLIVEDDEDFLSILRIKFEGEGFNVVTAQDGENGIDIAEREKPDLILSDVLLPKTSGIEMAKKIKESDKNALIVFLTNLTDANSSGEIKKLGFDYLVKSNLGIGDIVDKVKEKLNIT